MSQLGTAASATAKVGHNDLCPCGSGRKFKRCCKGKDARWGPPAGTTQGSSATPRQRQQELFLAAKKYRDAGKWADAIPLLREGVRLMPNDAEALFNLGAAYANCNRLPEAEACLQRALELRPSFEEALKALAHILKEEGRISEASQAFRKLSRTAADPVERRHWLAGALDLEGKQEEAEKEYRRLLAVAPQRAETRMQLGRLLSSRGMFDEAAQQLTMAIEALPDAFYLLTAVKRMTESDRSLIDRMSVIARRPDLAHIPHIGVHFGLGKAFEDLGDYKEAIQHYDAANELRAALTPFDRVAMSSLYDRIIALFPAEELARLGQTLARPACPGDDTPVFIVGMPRSGTTLVEQILSSHPAVAAGGERDFWRSQLASWRASRIDPLGDGVLAKAAEDYRRELRAIGPQALRVTDKRVMNFKMLGLLRLAFPDARIIHCRRNPIDTCLSIFFTNLVGGHDYAWDRGDLVFAYRQYERLMNHWRRVLPADRFKEVEYETLIADRELETRRLVAFCGLEWSDACLSPERSGRVVNTSSLWQARQPVYATSVDRWRRYEPWLGELRELLPAADAAALIMASQEGHLEVVQALLAAKAHVNMAAAGPPALYSASGFGHQEVVQALLGAKADANAKTADGTTILMIASQNGHVDVVNTLLAAGADVNAARGDGGTALHLASQNGSLEAVRALLVAKAEVNAKAANGATALLIASQFCRAEVVRALLDAKANVNAEEADGATALLVASQNGHLDVAQTLIGAKAKVNAKRADGATALIMASQNDFVEVVRALLAAGADVNAKSADGVTALLIASQQGFLEVVRALLAAKADVNARDIDGGTALMRALKFGHPEVARLLDAGADIDASLVPVHKRQAFEII